MRNPEFLNIDLTFDLEDGSDYKYIDPVIRSLVMVMNDMGISTDSSCQGHIQKGKWPFPWIGIYGFIGVTGTKRRKGYNHFLGLVNQFCSEDGITWQFNTNNISPSEKSLHKLGMMPPFSRDYKTFSISDGENKLKILQKSAQELADFLQSSQG